MAIDSFKNGKFHLLVLFGCVEGYDPQAPCLGTNVKQGVSVCERKAGSNGPNAAAQLPPQPERDVDNGP
jgi:hypothetical protein